MSHGRLKVLHIEDDASLAALLQATAKRAGDLIECVRAATLAEGMACLEAQSFDLVLLDLGLPDASPDEVLARVAGHTRAAILVYTGSPPQHGLPGVRVLSKGEVDASRVITEMFVEVARAASRDTWWLETAQGLAGFGTGIVDLKTERVRWSDHNFRIHGLEPGDAVPNGIWFRTRVHPDDRKTYDDFVERVGHLEGEEGASYRLRLPDESYRQLSVVMRPLTNGHGQPTHLLTTTVDTTSRAEAAARPIRDDAHRRSARAVMRHLLAAQPGVDDLIRRRRVGRVIADDVIADDLRGFMSEFEALGFGQLTLQQDASDVLAFEGRDLVDSEVTARVSTADLTLGFLERTCERLRGGSFLGAETRDGERVRFVVMRRKL